VSQFTVRMTEGAEKLNYFRSECTGGCKVFVLLRKRGEDRGDDVGGEDLDKERNILNGVVKGTLVIPLLNGRGTTSGKC